MSLIFRIMKKDENSITSFFEDNLLSGYSYVPIFDFLEDQNINLLFHSPQSETASITYKIDKMNAHAIINCLTIDINDLYEYGELVSTDKGTLEQAMHQILKHLDLLLLEKDDVSYIFELY